MPGPEVVSVAYEDLAVEATIDWDAVEREQTLSDLLGTHAVQVTSETPPEKRKEGTTIELRRAVF